MTKEMIEEIVGGQFWTREEEMIEELEENFEVDEVTGEYVTVVDDEENCFILRLGHANTTMWVESIREM